MQFSNKKIDLGGIISNKILKDGQERDGFGRS
jgi:hypothetical protein